MLDPKTTLPAAPEPFNPKSPAITQAELEKRVDEARKRFDAACDGDDPMEQLEAVANLQLARDEAGEPTYLGPKPQA
ncbi:MAG: hypothetical protein FWD61_18445 [Phycisphaerales bacterium]|nr:hypothetical protein [Phycisphaerales bacterium]